MADGNPQESAATETPASSEVITTYKGFDANLACRGYQFEVGKEFVHEGEVSACNGGFHACEYPLDVFGYYPPADSRYCAVEQSGTVSRHDGDSKVASERIKLTAEIGLPGIIKAAVEYTLKRAKPTDSASNSGAHGAASNSGDYGAASNSGTRGAASNSGADGVAMSAGYAGKVMGCEGSALFLVERDDEYKIVAVWSGIAGSEGIKAGTWYTLRAGQPVEV